MILLAVRWYLRNGLSYRDVEELLAERGVDVDHVTIYWWVQRFMPLVIEAARPCRHSVGDRWWHCCIDRSGTRAGALGATAIDQIAEVSSSNAAASRRCSWRASTPSS